MRRIILAALLAAPLMAPAANLVVNVSFEADVQGNDSWNFYSGIEVFWNGVSQGVFTGNGGSGNMWAIESMTVTGTASSSSLSFQAVGASDSLGVSLDAVSLTAAVPEPETYALMLAGLGAIGFVARRRRTAA